MAGISRRHWSRSEKQRHPNAEIIVFDGGSTDETRAVLEKFGAYITLWESSPDREQCHALNKGFARATGDIFGWLHATDLYLP